MSDDRNSAVIVTITRGPRSLFSNKRCHRVLTRVKVVR